MRTGVKLLCVAGMLYSFVNSIAAMLKGRFDEATFRLLWAIIFWYAWQELSKALPPPK